MNVGSTTPNNTVSGYFREDVNMENVTKYTGTGNDRDPVLLVVGSKVRAPRSKWRCVVRHLGIGITFADLGALFERSLRVELRLQRWGV